MKKLIISCLFLSIVHQSHAQYSGQIATNMSNAGQNSSAASAISTFLGPVNEAYQKRKEINLDKFQGSPYTSNNFAPAPLKYKDEIIGTIYYRYNALNEEIEIKKTPSEEELYQALNKDKAISLLINGKPLSFKTFITDKKETINGYLTLIFDGSKYDLYERTLVKFTEGQPAQNSFVAAIPSRFSKFTEYYFQKKGVNKINQVPQRNGKMLKLFEGSTKQDLKEYLKANDLNIKNQPDLIKVFEYLNKK
nr:hypothetical protein [uncultured Allomuricauda sp.]